MTKPKRIIVGYDFSTQADVALAQGVVVARRVGAELVLAHVGPVIEPVADAGRIPEKKSTIYRELDGRLADACARVSGEGVRVSQVLVEGEPDKALVEVQEELGAELLVVGSHGRSGVRWLLLGSVAERVTRTSRRSVLVARGQLAQRGGYGNIVVPMDFSDPSVAALELAIELAAHDARIEVLHCWQVIVPAFLDWGGSAFEPADVREDILAAAERRGRELLRRYEHRHRGLDLALVEQPPRQGIHRRLENGDCDLVALGSRGHRGVQRWLIGSVAESIARHAPCSVLVAHGRGAASASP